MSNRQYRPALAEFDLVNGLTGLGAHLLRRDPDGDLVRGVLAYLVRLTEPLGAEDLPGWWTDLAPTGRRSTHLPGGHGNWSVVVVDAEVGFKLVPGVVGDGAGADVVGGVEGDVAAPGDLEVDTAQGVAVVEPVEQVEVSAGEDGVGRAGGPTTGAIESPQRYPSSTLPDLR